MIIDPKVVASDICDIITKQDSQYKAQLDSSVHVVDLSLSALQEIDGSLDINAYKSMVSTFKRIFTSYTSLETMMAAAKDAPSNSWIGFANDPIYGQYLSAGDYATLQTGLNKVVSSLNTDSQAVDLNYVALKGTNSPVSQKAAEIVKKLPLIAAKPILQQFNAIYEASSILVDMTLSEADVKSLSDILGSATVLVTLKSSSTKQRAAAESSLADSVFEYVQSDKFLNKLVSPSAIADGVADLIIEQLSGKKVKRSNSTTSTARKTGSSKGKGSISQYKLPRLRNVTTGRFTSMASLEFLLRHKLAPQIKLNMGQGNRRDILNYRTGRFARSATIEKVTRSRDDFITVYYNYMRYPYATFSEGGAQQSPRSRDPKLLISKSIRDIASSVVSNRMRAVLI